MREDSGGSRLRDQADLGGQECAHTPGPWHINERHSRIEIIPVRPDRGFHGQYIEIAVIPFPRTGAKRGQTVRYLPTEQHRANARLIASAPSLASAASGMLAELKKVAAQFRFYEREHLAKASASAERGDQGGQAGSLAKARTNREFAESTEAAIEAARALGIKES